MKIILGGRASGKTTKLIQESAETGRRILTHNKEAAREIWWQAQSLGYDIPIPLTVMDLKPGTRAEIKKARHSYRRHRNHSECIVWSYRSYCNLQMRGYAFDYYRFTRQYENVL